MKKEVVISNKARKSVREIFEYIREREKSIKTAKYVKNKILEKCKSLSSFSGYSIDPFLEEFPEKYQSVSIWDYVIIYLTDDKQVKVLNVVHCKRHPDIRKEI
ncbi:MAG: type II toxin-antitoxin system RelE/ParE family toxin [Bacteroidales bacterium]|nr:type II toxin-antitoxin system RelE/ParE family toxin [Bacteroidales bacterium]